MASTYSPSLRIELPATGDQNDAWAATVDNNLAVPLEQGVTRVVTIPMADANVTLTAVDAAPDQARDTVLILTGALTADRLVIAPAVPKLYIVTNNTTGGHNVLMRTTTTPSGGLVIPPNATLYVYTDGGTAFSLGIDYLTNSIGAASMTINTPLATAYGGTGVNNAAAARTFLNGNGAGLLAGETTNVASSVVIRDAIGNFAAGTITASLTGTAATSTNTINFGGLPKTSYSAIDSRWEYSDSVDVWTPNLAGPASLDLYALGGAGIYFLTMFVSNSFFDFSTQVVAPSGTAIFFSGGSTVLGQLVTVGGGSTLTKVQKLRKSGAP